MGRLPRIEFGSGAISHLPVIAARHGRRLLILTGARSFSASPHWEGLRKALADGFFGGEIVRITGEPSPEEIDSIVQLSRDGVPFLHHNYQLPDGRWQVTWEIDNPRLNERYILKWGW